MKEGDRMSQLDRIENMLLFNYAMTLFVVAKLNEGFIGILFGIISAICLLLGMWDYVKNLKKILKER